MNCRKVQGLLPLHVEGDLSPRVARGVRLHLATCAPCREEEAAYLASQAFWKEAPVPAFDGPFYADVRRAVRVRIGQEKEARARRWRFVRAWAAVAASAAAVGAFVLVMARREPGPRFAASPTSVPLARPALPPVAVAAARPEPEPEPRVPPLHVLPRARQAREAVPAVSRVTRIEMKTDNPNVRIIWLAKAGDAAPI